MDGRSRSGQVRPDLSKNFCNSGQYRHSLFFYASSPSTSPLPDAAGAIYRFVTLSISLAVNELHPELTAINFALARAQLGLGQTRLALDTLSNASAVGLGSRDEMLQLLEQLCGILDTLVSDRMKQDKTMAKLCAPGIRLAAAPLASSAVSAPEQPHARGVPQ